MRQQRQQTTSRHRRTSIESSWRIKRVTGALDHTWNLSQGAGKSPNRGAPTREILQRIHSDRERHGFRLSIRHGGVLMHFKLLAAAGVASLLLFTPAAADASCCNQAKMAGHDMKGGCCDMPCCADHAVNTGIRGDRHPGCSRSRTTLSCSRRRRCGSRPKSGSSARCGSAGTSCRAAT